MPDTDRLIAPWSTCRRKRRGVNGRGPGEEASHLLSGIADQDGEFVGCFYTAAAPEGDHLSLSDKQSRPT